MRKKITLMLMALFALAAFAATQVLNQATRRAAVSFDVPDGTELSAFIQSVIAENPAVEAYVFNLAANASYTLSAPIEVGKSISIIGDAENPATIDASAVTSTIVRMATPSFAANVKGFYEIDKLALENLVVKGVNYYIYDDNKNAYAFSNFIINNCLFELTNNKQDIDCPFRFQAGGPVKFSMTNSTMYQKGSFNYKYFVKIGSGNFPEKAFATFDGPYTWTIENNTFYKCLTDKMEFLNGGRVSNNYKKTAISLKNNIFVDCSKGDSFLKNLFGSKSSDKDLADFVSMETANNTYFAGGSAVPVHANKYDKGLILPTDPGFADPENGDFTIGAGTAQAKEQTGDPRWLVEYDETKRPSKDVTVSPESGDINAAVTAELGEYFAGAKSLTVNLAAGAEYTVSAPLIANGNITINGNGATIDASAVRGPLFQYKAPEVAAGAPRRAPATPVDGYTYLDKVEIKDVTITGVKGSIFWDGNVKTCIESFSIENAVIELATESSSLKDNTLISFQGGSAKDFTIKNTTIYGNGVAKYFNKASGNDCIKAGYDAATVTYENNTFYNVLKASEGQWGNNLRYNNNKAKVVASINNNIWVDCGDGQIMRRLLNTNFKDMKSGSTMANNTFWSNGATVDQGNYGNGSDLPTDPGFKDAANGDFTIGKRTHQNLYQTGDPRWLKDTEDYIAPQVGVSGTAAIDLTVPANLGKMDGTNGPTDLALFLDSYLQNSPNPAYIKLTLEPGAKYTISKPLTTMTAITIVGDESNPALIDASSLTGSFVEADELYAAGDPNANDFLTSIYNVELKNFEVKNLGGALFNANGQKYVIPNFTVENVLVQTTGGTVIDMDGSVVENLTVTKSTMNGAALAYKATTDAASAGVTAQTINASYNTFYQVIGLQIGAMLTAPQMSNRSMAPTSNLSLDFNHNVVISDNFAFSGSVPSMMLVQYNSFVKEDGTDNNAILAKIPGVGGTIEGDLTFATPDDVVNGNLGLGVCPQREAKIGDPRWLNAAMKISAADLDDDKDLAKAINAAVEIGITKFQLEENARYTAKQTIVADKAIAITGKNVIIDVEHNDPFILLSKTPTGGFMPKASTEAAAPALNRAAAVEYTDYYKFDELTLSGLKVNGLKNSIIYDNNVKYCVIDLTIDDCVMQLETEAVKYEALIAFQAGGVNNLTVRNSTFYGNNEVAKYFVRYNNSARIDRFGFDKADDTWSFTYENNTFYGLLKSDGQWGNYNGITQKMPQFIVTVKNNIWYNCDAQTMRRLLHSKKFEQFSSASQMENNTFIVGGEAVDQGDYGNGSDLTGDPGFKDAANGDFTLSAYSAQCNEKTGDPRWFAEGGHYNPVTGIETVKTAEETSLENAVIYNLNGQRVEKAQKGINIVNGKKVIIK